MWSHVKNGGEVYPSIHPSFAALKELQLAELETMSPWQVKLCPLGTGWNWTIGLGFLLDEQGWKEGLLEFFFVH